MGCSTKPVVGKATVFQFIKVPKELTKKVYLSRPPEPESYSLQVWTIQEGMLMDLIQNRTTEIGVCNARLSGIADWSDKEAIIYNGK